MYKCRQCIVDHIRACGPQTRKELIRECEEQALDYDAPTFEFAMIQLEQDGVIEAEVYQTTVEEGPFTAWGLTPLGYAD